VKTRSGVLRRTGTLPSVETLEVSEPGSGEVLIRMAAAGLCFSDVRIASGDVPMDLPMVMGHEGSGIVERAGPGVGSLEPGDAVILFGRASCGRCRRCLRGQSVYCAERTAVRSSAMYDGTFRFSDASGAVGTASTLGCFSEYTVCSAGSCVKVPPDVDLVEACLLSCGATTGLGAALRVARVQPGDDVVVFGVGGVGTAALQGCVIAGAAQVIAVDTVPSRARVAMEMGATSFIAQGGESIEESVLAATGGHGAAHVLLCQSSIDAAGIERALACLDVGGTLTIVGGLHLDTIDLPARAFHWNSQRLATCFMGGLDPIRDIPVYTELLRAGRLRLGPMITARYRLDDLETAFDDLRSGRNVRGVITFADVGALAR
jgi:Zn-dependent alcohol dehydrogenase